MCVSYHSTLPANTGANVRMRNLLLNLEGLRPILLAPGPHDTDLQHRVIEPRQTPALLRQVVGINPRIFGLSGKRGFRRALAVLRDLEVAAVQCEHLWSFPLACRLACHLSVPLILVEHNVEAVYTERAYNLPLLSRVVASFERRALQRCDRVVVCSEVDAAVLVERYGVEHERIWIVPNGVNLPEKRNARQSQALPDSLRNRKLVLFLGKTDYPPNAEAIRIIQEELAPRLKAHTSSAVLAVVGGPREADYSQIERGLVFTGYVQDLQEWLAAASVCIAPLTSGSGTRLKLLEYAAHAKPIVATSVAAEGLKLRDGEELLLADDWNKFVEAILTFTREPEHAAHLACQAYRSVEREYQWTAIAARYQEQVETLLDSLEGGSQKNCRLTAEFKMPNVRYGSTTPAKFVQER